MWNSIGELFALDEMATSTPGNGSQMPLENPKDEFTTVVLEPLVKALLSENDEPNQIENVLLVNYCRWWIMALIDSLDELKTFTLSTHEHKIASYRENGKQPLPEGRSFIVS